MGAYYNATLPDVLIQARRADATTVRRNVRQPVDAASPPASAFSTSTSSSLVRPPSSRTS
jgi:hypothetical protein